MTLFRLLLLAGLLLLPTLAADRPAKPNIVLMMVDDMGVGDSSAYLGVRLDPSSEPIARTLRTPQLDAFAKQAMLFTQANAPASMCSSTRYSLLTGRFAHRPYLKKQGWLPHGPNRPMIQRALTTLPDMLQRAGYHTGCVGKYHVGLNANNGHGQPVDTFGFEDCDFTKPLLDGPTHHGFNEFFGVPGNTEDALDTEPRIFIRNDRWTFTDRSKMIDVGIQRRKGRVIASPDWDMTQLGPIYLREVRAYIERRAKETKPFFLYYVPNANHAQRNLNGYYAVPDSIDGEAVKGASRYTDDQPGGERNDMVLENDIAFGRLLTQLRETPDPRWPGHQLIENTLVIFTSDNGPNVGNNDGRNPESGGLKGKKAKIWEGGLRVPFLAAWPGKLEAGTQNNSPLSLTDLYATFAAVVGHELQPDEGQDSHNVWGYWTGTETQADLRPRLYFCHLGPPFLNDCLALRMGPHKVLLRGGLARPWAKGGSLGQAIAAGSFDLSENPNEEADKPLGPERLDRLVEMALLIHNRGYAREIEPVDPTALIQQAGWHNLRNDLSGEIGFDFLYSPRGKPQTLSHLGMWDDHGRDQAARDPRGVPTDRGSDRPPLADQGGNKRGLAVDHTIRLLDISEVPPIELARVSLPAGGKPSALDGAFRYGALEKDVELKPRHRYRLLMSTTAGDGDHFQDPASFDGLSPILHPDILVERSVLVREKAVEAIPAFSDLHENYGQFRLPLGPVMKFNH